MDNVVYETDLVDETWEKTITKADANEIKLANLIEEGQYPGLIQPDVKTTLVKTQQGGHPLEGKMVTRLHAVLNGSGRDWHYFFDAYPEVVKATADSGGTYIPQACKNAEMLYKALDMYGKPWGDVVTAAQGTTLLFVMTISTPKDPVKAEKYGPQNAAKIKAYSAL